MNDEPVIRLASATDLAKLKEIINLSFPRFFRFFAKRSADSEEGKVLVAEERGGIAGFAKLIEFLIADKKYGCILWLAVHPNCRRRGFASILVEAGFGELKRAGAVAIFASVQRQNKASLGVFAKKGFFRTGFVYLLRVFGWRALQLCADIWYAPSEVILMRFDEKT